MGQATTTVTAREGRGVSGAVCPRQVRQGGPGARDRASPLGTREAEGFLVCALPTDDTAGQMESSAFLGLSSHQRRRAQVPPARWLRTYEAPETILPFPVVEDREGREGLMPSLKLFNVSATEATEVIAHPAVRERHVQELIERNMEALLGVRFLASEYGTGSRHRGRIDSLGLDENGAPVIVEFTDRELCCP